VQLTDRIEKRRFVGREFLLWLWFESELMEGTLQTKQHGEFGLWLEKKLVLSEGKESTRIAGGSPGLGREAKEALRRGQLPESAGIRVVIADEENSFVLKAEQLAVASLKLKTVLGQDEEERNVLLEELMPSTKPKRKQPKSEDEAYEAFYERMQLTQAFEELLGTLYHDFLTLRLKPVWADLVVPAMRAWVAGESVDADAYQKRRARNLR